MRPVHQSNPPHYSFVQLMLAMVEDVVEEMEIPEAVDAALILMGKDEAQDLLPLPYTRT